VLPPILSLAPGFAPAIFRSYGLSSKFLVSPTVCHARATVGDNHGLLRLFFLNFASDLARQQIQLQEL